jgi:hypothetical protein
MTPEAFLGKYVAIEVFTAINVCLMLSLLLHSLSSCPCLRQESLRPGQCDQCFDHEWSSRSLSVRLAETDEEAQLSGSGLVLVFTELSLTTHECFALHVAFRDSKLTRLLSDSLGGNSKTLLIVSCPNQMH